MHRIRSSLKLLLAIFTTILLIFVLSALLPPHTAKQQLISQVLITHLAGSNLKSQSSQIQQQKQLEVHKKEIVQETRHHNIISKVESETTEITPVSPVFMKQQWKPLEVNETDTAIWNHISKRDVMAETTESSTVHVKQQQRKPLNVKINENIVSEGYVPQDRARQDSIPPSHQSVTVVNEKQQPSISNPLTLSESSSKAQYNRMERNRKRLEQLRAQHWEALRHQHGRTQTLPQNISHPTQNSSTPHFQNSSTHSVGNLKREEVDGVEAFVFFVGWQRSGHSIIGSLLDGHPDVVIAHELFLFSNLPQFIFMEDAKVQLFRTLYLSSYRASKAGARSKYHNEKGYNLHLENSWQGSFRKLRVIGDKTAGDVTNSFSHDPVMFQYLLRRLSEIVSVPLKVINVVRNPFDMVATLTLYRGSTVKNVKVNATEKNKYNNTNLLEWSTAVILRKAKALYQMEENHYDWRFTRLYSEDFIGDPKTTMAALCTFLGIECTENYLQQCADKTFSSVSKSRHLIVWNPYIVADINKIIRTIPFLRRYSFDGI